MQYAHVSFALRPDGSVSLPNSIGLVDGPVIALEELVGDGVVCVENNSEKNGGGGEKMKTERRGGG